MTVSHRDKPGRMEPTGRRGPVDQPPRPRPLLLPALALLGGIWLSERLGALDGAARLAVFCAPLLLAAIFLLLLSGSARRSPRRPASLKAPWPDGRYAAAALLLLAASVGFARHQSALHLPPEHIAHLLTDEPLLTKLAGQIITAPVAQPAEKHNPFLPFDPPAGTRFILDVRELRTTAPPTPVRGCVRVAVDGAEMPVRMGDRVEIVGRLHRPIGRRNPGETDWAFVQRCQGVYAGLSVESPQFVTRDAGPDSLALALVARLRAYSRALLFDASAQADPDEGLRLLDAMLLGQRSSVSRQVDEAFVRTGAVHILSVSGSHIGVLAAAAWFLMRGLLRRSVWATAAATLMAVLVYALIAEPNAPIVRSALMAVFGCTAIWFRRMFCGLNWLALAAVCVLLWNPFELFQPGFQLSFLQVLALFTVVPPLYQRLTRGSGDEESAVLSSDAHNLPQLLARGIGRTAIGLVLVSAVAWVASAPLVAYHFGLLTPLGILQSALLTPFFALVLVLGFVTLLFQVVLPPLGGLILGMLDSATNALVWIVRGLAGLPGTLIEVPSPPAWLILATYAGVAGVLAWRAAERRERAAALAVAATPGSPPPLSRSLRVRRWLTAAIGPALALAWLGWATAPRLWRRECVDVHVLAVGSGSAALVAAPDGRGAFFDLGTIGNSDAGEVGRAALRKLRLGPVERITISHDNFDHYGGIPTLLEHIPAQVLNVNGYFHAAAGRDEGVQRFLQMIAQRGPPLMTLQAGDGFDLGPAHTRVLWPPTDLRGASANDTSLVLMLEAFGRRVLIPGDLERDGIRGLLASHGGNDPGADLHADVLIAPHHGSVISDTDDLLRAVRPSWIIISTGKPRPQFFDLARRVLGEECHVLSTRDVGAVTLSLHPDGSVIVQTPFAPRR